MSARQQEIQRLERRCAELEMILRRRESYVEMIDWEAMTQAERDWGQHGYTEEIHWELVEIEDRLYDVDPGPWGFG